MSRKWLKIIFFLRYSVLRGNNLLSGSFTTDKVGFKLTFFISSRESFFV